MSDVEQTSPMVEKDKVPDGTGSDPSNRKKSPLDRIRRPKMGKRIKSVSSAASFPRAILSLWFLAKKKEGGIIPVFSLLNVWVGVIVYHFSNNIIGWKMTNKNQGNLYIALLPFTYPIWNWNQAHDLHIKFWRNWGIIEIWLDHWAIQFTFTCGYTIFPDLSDSRFSPGTTKAPIISVNPKSY